MYTDTTDTNPIIDSVYFLVLDYRPFLICDLQVYIQHTNSACLRFVKVSYHCFAASKSYNSMPVLMKGID